jgi:integrase
MATNNLPPLPRPDFPLNPKPNGQWGKKFKDRSTGKWTPKYFGSWKTDPQGVAAEAEYRTRLPGILAGTDSTGVVVTAGDWTVETLVTEFLKAKKAAAEGKKRSLTTLGDYLRELQAFAAFTSAGALVKALRPEHFTAYAHHLGGERKLGPHAFKRVVRYVRAAFQWGADNGKFTLPSFGTEFVAPDTGKDAMRQHKARNDLADHSARIVTGPELDKMLDRANPNFKAILLLAANCGLGPADLGRLKWRHLDLEAGRLDFPRGKTGTPRKGHLWKKSRSALARVRTLKNAKAAIEAKGRDALVFVARRGLSMYEERLVTKTVDGKVKASVVVRNAISITVGRIAADCGLEGVTLYRFRHGLRTLGQRARDTAALNLAMGHRERTTGETYNHEEPDWTRLKRVARKVYKAYWPTAKQEGTLQPGQLRIAGGDAAAA